MKPTFEIKGILSGNVLKTVTNPAALIEKEYGIIIAIGDADEMQTELQHQQGVTNAFRRESQKLVIAHIPHDQGEVDKAFSTTGYALELYKNQQPGAKSVLTFQGV